MKSVFFNVLFGGKRCPFWCVGTLTTSGNFMATMAFIPSLASKESDGFFWGPLVTNSVSDGLSGDFQDLHLSSHNFHDWNILKIELPKYHQHVQVPKMEVRNTYVFSAYVRESRIPAPENSLVRYSIPATWTPDMLWWKWLVLKGNYYTYCWWFRNSQTTTMLLKPW